MWRRQACGKDENLIRGVWCVLCVVCCVWCICEYVYFCLAMRRHTSDDT